MNAVEATLLFWCAGLSVGLVMLASLLWYLWREFKDLKSTQFHAYMSQERALNALRDKSHVHHGSTRRYL